MSQRIQNQKPGLASLVGVTVLLVVTFTLIGFVALSVLTGNNFGLGDSTNAAFSTPQAAAAPRAAQVSTPDAIERISFKSAALGISLEYPQRWRKNEQGLQVILSPSTQGLDPDNLRDAAIWFGIPVDNTVEPGELLARLRVDVAPAGQLVSNNTLRIGGETWQSARIRFENEQLGGQTMATIATTSKNEVGYFMVAAAPAEQWDAIQPVFQTVLDSFRFTTEAVLRPTDATPPPTPTPTPTPVFYVVQSGDTLSKIAVQYGVTVEALANRNGIDDPRSLRTGQTLIIPLKRR